MEFKKLYYHAKPLIPRRLQIAMRRQLVRRKRRLVSNVWPIDPDAARPPLNWRGWPGGKKFSFVLTHDVELADGCSKCLNLMKLEEKFGFRSSFNFVPERYNVSEMLRKMLERKGFEVGVHGLNHDGKLYQSQEEFLRRAKKINQYIQDWQTVGFRSPAMHHNLDWLRELNIEYDASTFDTDPFEPQSDGVGTIFPFQVNDADGKKGYLELPYTLPQDFTVFILMQEKSPAIWKRKLDWIAENGGMALVNVHPDYMNFDDNKLGIQEFPAEIYADFLNYVKTEYAGEYWHALAKEVARFWAEDVYTPVDLEKYAHAV